MIGPTPDSDREFAEALRDEILEEFDGDEARAIACMAELTATFEAATAVNQAASTSRKELGITI